MALNKKKKGLQRIARTDKKAFLNEQCKEIKENSRMGKTGYFFNKIGEIKETFHAKMGTIKERNGKGLTEAKEIKKRWQEYTKVKVKVKLLSRVRLFATCGL